MPVAERSLPQFSPTPRELDDVEILRMGVLAPLDGLEGKDGEVTLAVPTSVARWGIDAGGLEIVDPESVPLAVISIKGTYPITPDVVGISGPVRPLPGRQRRPFGRLYVPPSDTRAALPSSTLTVPVTTALTEDDLREIAATAGGSPILLIALTGAETPRNLSPHGLIRATIAAADLLDDAQVIAVPVAARLRPESDVPFRQRVAASYAPGKEILWPSSHGPRPERIQVIVDADRPTGRRQGIIVFFTGFSGSGKSTIAQALCNELIEHGVRTVSLLDGDRVRQNLSSGLTFSQEDRETNIARIGWVAAEIARHGGMAVCSPIAPFDRTRKLARAFAEEVGSAFLLVHVSTPLAECERRDRKGLYAKARRGEIEHFTGISSPYEAPDDAEITVDTTDRTVMEVRDIVLDALRHRGLIETA